MFVCYAHMHMYVCAHEHVCTYVHMSVLLSVLFFPWWCCHHFEILGGCGGILQEGRVTPWHAPGHGLSLALLPLSVFGGIISSELFL